MATTLQGALVGTGLKIGIVVSRFNKIITERLLSGALEDLERHGVSQSDVTVVWVPGAFEIPLTAKVMAKTEKYDAIVCLGCVIRGATAHFDYVAGGSQSGIMGAGMDTSIPCVFGVLTTDTQEQAFDRAGGKAGNKGGEAAITAIEMANVLKTIRKS